MAENNVLKAFKTCPKTLITIFYLYDQYTWYNGCNLVLLDSVQTGKADTCVIMHGMVWNQISHQGNWQHQEHGSLQDKNFSRTSVCEEPGNVALLLSYHFLRICQLRCFVSPYSLKVVLLKNWICGWHCPLEQNVINCYMEWRCLYPSPDDPLCCYFTLYVWWHDCCSS